MESIISMNKDQEIVLIFSSFQIFLYYSFYQMVFTVIGMIFYINRKNIKVLFSFMPREIKLFPLKIFQLSILASFPNKELTFVKALVEIIFLLNFKLKIFKLKALSNLRKNAIFIIYLIIDAFFLEINWNEYLITIAFLCYFILQMQRKKKSGTHETSSKSQSDLFKDIEVILDDFDGLLAIYDQTRNKIYENKKFAKENSKSIGSLFNDYIDDSSLVCGNSLNENFSIFLKNKLKYECKKYYKIIQGQKLRKKFYFASISKLELTIDKDSPIFIIYIKKISNKKRNPQIEEIDKYISNILNSISHQLFTPMNGLIGMFSTIKKKLPCELKNDFKICQLCSRILNNTITMMLDFSLLLVNKLIVQKEFVEVELLLKEVNKMFKFQCKLKNIIFSIEFEKSLPKFIEIDYLRVKMILFILIENSIKYTVKGFVSIKIYLNSPELVFSVQDSGIGISKSKIDEIIHQEDFFTFRDNGQKSNQLGSEKQPLGILIALKLIKKMGSFLYIESEKNKGTVMQFSLKARFSQTHIIETCASLNPIKCRPIPLPFPKESGKFLSFNESATFSSHNNLNDTFLFKKFDFKKGITKPTEKNNNNESFDQICDENISNLDNEVKKHIIEKFPNPIFGKASTHFPVPLHNKIGICQSKSDLINLRKISNTLDLFILIVDDELFNRMVLNSMIKSINKSYSIKEASNGKEAVELVNNNPRIFSLIFMDLNMPIMGGIEATIHIRRCLGPLNIRTPIIALTAFKAEIEKDKCLKAGMNYFANKPLKINELRDILNKYLHH